MSCKLVKDRRTNLIPMNDLPGGKIGVIESVDFGDGEQDFHADYVGMLVQRDSHDNFIILGSRCGTHSNYFGSKCRHLVRVLEEGEVITVNYTG